MYSFLWLLELSHENKYSFFEHNVQILSFLGILHMRPHSIDNLWLIVLNLQRAVKSLSFKILK